MSPREAAPEQSWTQHTSPVVTTAAFLVLQQLSLLGSGEGTFCHPKLGLLSCPVLLPAQAAREPCSDQITALLSKEQPREASGLHFRGAAQENSRVLEKNSQRYKLKLHCSKNYRCLLEILRRREGTVQEVLILCWRKLPCKTGEGASKERHLLDLLLWIERGLWVMSQLEAILGMGTTWHGDKG